MPERLRRICLEMPSKAIKGVYNPTRPATPIEILTSKNHTEQPQRLFDTCLFAYDEEKHFKSTKQARITIHPFLYHDEKPVEYRLCMSIEVRAEKKRPTIHTRLRRNASHDIDQSTFEKAQSTTRDAICWIK